MSKIDELISKYCPNGVVYRKVSDVAKVSIGEFVHKNNQNPDGLYPVYNGGTSNTGYYDEFNNTANKIIISARGANAGFVNKVLVDYWAGNSCYTIDVVSDELDWIFVYYFLKNSEKSLIGQQQTGSIPAVSKKQIETFKIPLPPLSVQQEIVRILDGFSELEKELEKELVARRKQYEYYRNQLVSFGEGGDHACDVKWMKLGEVVKIQNGFAFKSTLFKNHGVPVLRITNIQSSGVVAENLIFVDTSDYTVNFESFKVFPGDVVVALSGATTGKSAKNKTNLTYLLNQRVAKFIPNENMLLNSYLYHWTKSKENEFLQMAGGGAQPNLSTEQMKIMAIPIPPIAEQERIVAILDKFDALVNDISVGLPAELKARRKQYEYWRNKLLDFKEAV